MADRPFRIAVLRCDTHAYWYGPQAFACDPLRLQQHNYVCHHYFTDVYSPSAWTIPHVDGFELACCWDYEREKAERYAATFPGDARAVDTPEAATEGVDAAFIADCNDEGADHLALARPFLERGLPVFVDKPFARTLADAQELVRLSREHDTPLMSASLLGFSAPMTQFRLRFAELARVSLIVAKGVGPGLAAIIHGVALAQGLYDRALNDDPAGAAESVEALGDLELEVMKVRYADGREALILNMSIDHFPRSCTFYASAYGKGGAIHSGPCGDFEFMTGGEVILRMFGEMIETRRPPVPYDALLEKIAIVEAGRVAQAEHRKVQIGEVWSR
ncbi:MAG: Gfo/Idh/MocA family oxidoreductase [Armatimonadetes bacterium]|nr:Gfo/Idh/MocA family oxidoreductase [Armatimonadota bacterium]